MQISPSAAILQAISEAAATAAANRTAGAPATPATPATRSAAPDPGATGKIPAPDALSPDALSPDALSPDSGPNPRLPRGSLLDISA